MKKGFTLVELLVVVVVIVTLMTVTFRIADITSESTARNKTVMRMERIENALSGYYAAYGSYPPVSDEYASRNVYLRVNATTDEQEDAEEGELVWASVRAACLAQPVEARFPFSRNMQSYVDNCSRIASQRANSSDKRFSSYRNNSRILGGGFSSIDNPNQLTGWDSDWRWQDVKIFKFGVMSFLMPRYLCMLKGLDVNNNENILDKCKQWGMANRLPANPNDGKQFTGWSAVLDENRASLLRRISSQSICARWMPNFEGIVSCSWDNKELFGIRIWDDDDQGAIPVEDGEALARFLCNDGSGRYYALDRITVLDGWRQDFYYYSPPPFQSYRLWSSGPNRKTFPPWYPLEKLKSEGDKRKAMDWMGDDISFMSN